MSEQPTITRINQDTLSIIINDEAEPQIIKRHSDRVCNIDFGSPEVQRFFWAYLESLAAGSPIISGNAVSKLDAVIQSILDRLDALEGGGRLAAQLAQEQTKVNHSQVQINEEVYKQIHSITDKLAARGIRS